MIYPLLLLTTALSTLAHPSQSGLPIRSTSHEKRGSSSFPASYEVFSSEFKQPEPPIVKAEFRCSWKQHKWDTNVSNIAAGYLYNSPSQGAVRIDAAFEGSIASSLFDYKATNSEGLVLNTVYTLSPSVAAKPAIYQEYVVPAWALFTPDVLKVGNGVFMGIVWDRWVGEVASWKILYGGFAQVTVYLDASNTLLGYDFHENSALRTGFVNRFFNIEFGPVGKEVFAFPKKA